MLSAGRREVNLPSLSRHFLELATAAECQQHYQEYYSSSIEIMYSQRGAE
jgi:hypothetical protein